MMSERRRRRVWTRAEILSSLRIRFSSGKSLAYRVLEKADRPLLAAAIYHFGSYQHAVESAGLNYQQVVQRPRWTKDRIIKQIKSARRAHHDLCWAAVIHADDSLRRAAFAAVRLFGTWARALQTAGVDVDEFRRYRAWDKPSVAFDLRQRHAEGEPMNSAAVQAADAGLYAAAIRYFGTFDHALAAARLKPSKVRMRKKASARTAQRRR